MFHPLVNFHVSNDTSVQTWFLVLLFLLIYSSVLNLFLSTLVLQFAQKRVYGITVWE